MEVEEMVKNTFVQDFNKEQKDKFDDFDSHYEKILL
jgi:hypothetical protein